MPASPCRESKVSEPARSHRWKRVVWRRSWPPSSAVRRSKWSVRKACERDECSWKSLDDVARRDVARSIRLVSPALE